MLIDLGNFSHSLALWAQGRANAQTPSLGIKYRQADDGGAVNLIRNEAIEGLDLGDPYAVLRIYGGTSEKNNPKPTANFQLATYSETNAGGLRFAQGLFEAFALTAQGQPIRQALINGFAEADDSAAGKWMIVNVDPIGAGRPAQLGRDPETNKVKFVSNFEVGFYPTN